MTKEVAKTGENLNRLEDIVVHANENTHKAEKEISNAEKETRGTTRKILWLTAIICFVAISIVLLVLFVFKK